MHIVHAGVTTQLTALRLVAAVLALAALGACTPTHLVVTDVPLLPEIRTVYVHPFASGDQEPATAAALTHALKAQLQADGIFQVVDDPRRADAYFTGAVGKGARGGLDWRGARSSVLSGSLTLRTAAGRRLWYAAAVQQDPWRLVAHGLFARDPGALAPAWVRAVLAQLPGYAPQERPGSSVRRDPGAPRPPS
jgi:hypothetical protein